MKTNERNELIDALIEGDLPEADCLRLEAELSVNPSARKAYFDRVALTQALKEEASAFPLSPVSLPSEHRSIWFTSRPLLAAAAGIVFGMLCTSMVYGFVAHREPGVEKVPMTVFDPGLEGAGPLHDGLPDEPGSWGVDAAAFVPAENGVSPSEGSRMLRLNPIPREKEVKNHTSRVYQVRDLRSLPTGEIGEGNQVQVTASFSAAGDGASSRYLIRGVALEETPEVAMNDFWSKTENDDVVSVSERFDAAPGVDGWHTFSLKIPLQRGAKAVVLVLGALPPADGNLPAPVHYLDDVQVSLLKVASPSAESAE